MSMFEAHAQASHLASVSEWPSPSTASYSQFGSTHGIYSGEALAARESVVLTRDKAEDTTPPAPTARASWRQGDGAPASANGSVSMQDLEKQSAKRGRVVQSRPCLATRAPAGMWQLTREEVQKQLANAENFSYSQPHRDLYGYAADVALKEKRVRDIFSHRWKLGDRWLESPVNLQSMEERGDFFACQPDVYDYNTARQESLIVDFANKHVGGGCFGGGFVQEEQMVTQSSDFAARLKSHQDYMSNDEAITYEGVHMDLWWSREAAAKKHSLDLERDVQECPRGPFNVIAVNAPVMSHRVTYSLEDLQMLAMKTHLIFEVARELDSPEVFSGLLGGGAFRGNRPLILLLHLLLQPQANSDNAIVLNFHNPIFWSFGGMPIAEMESSMVDAAAELLSKLRKAGVQTMQEALQEIVTWKLSTSEGDKDIVGRQQKESSDHSLSCFSLLSDGIDNLSKYGMV